MHTSERVTQSVALLHKRLTVLGVAPDSVHLDVRVARQLWPAAMIPCEAVHVQSQGEVSYYVCGHSFYIVTRRGGILHTDCAQQTVSGYLTPPVLDDPVMLDDLLASAVAPLLRRRGFFPLHAFAAAWQGQGVLLVGKSGSGKTTAGLALIRSGWRFLSDDGPFLSNCGSEIRILGWHAPVNVTWTTARLFPELKAIFATYPGQAKCGFAIDWIYGPVLATDAPARLILLPSVTGEGPTRASCLSPAVVLAELMAHSIDGWDKDIMAEHFGLLSALVETAPAYRVHLGRDLDRFPEMARVLLGGQPDCCDQNVAGCL